MEHRLSRRTPLRCGVTVYSTRLGSAIGHARDIGIGGMFIETGTLLFTVHAPLVVRFSLDDDQYAGVFRLESMVVRRAAHGMGVMFLETAPEITDALARVLYGEQRVIRLPEMAPIGDARAVSGSRARMVSV